MKSKPIEKWRGPVGGVGLAVAVIGLIQSAFAGPNASEIWGAVFAIGALAAAFAFLRQ